MEDEGGVGPHGGAPASGQEKTNVETNELNLRAHYKDVIRSLDSLFVRMEANQPGPWAPFIEYRLTTGVAYYFNEGQTISVPLKLPHSLEDVKDDLKSHLGDETWAMWEHLLEHTRSHLEAVVETWGAIRKNIDAKAQAIGLFPHEKLADRPLDIYWPSLFVVAIWEDLGYYERNRAHLWERTEVVSEQTLVPMRHTVDVVQTWVFSGLPWVLTQSRDAANEMKKAWAEEAMAIEPRVWDLLVERTRLEEQAREVQRRFERLKVEYEGYGRRLPNFCKRCGPSP